MDYARSGLGLGLCSVFGSVVVLLKREKKCGKMEEKNRRKRKWRQQQSSAHIVEVKRYRYMEKVVLAHRGICVETRYAFAKHFNWNIK